MTASSQPDYSTHPPEVSLATWTRSAWTRRIFIFCLVVFIGAAAFNRFGLREEEVTASGSGYRLTVRYPAMSRSGISSPWYAEVSHPGGFDGPVTIATTIEYLTIFDNNGIFPDPSASTSKDGLVEWEFDPPAGDTLRVHVDTRIEPAVHSGESATTQLIVDHEVVAEVDYVTRLAP